jgi:pimeloyl-ACP methyl ester carboxylesterase
MDLQILRSDSRVRWAVVAKIMVLSLLTACGLNQTAVAQQPPRFEVTLAKELTQENLNGRLFVYLSKHADPPPMFGPNWFAPEPFFGMNVSDWKPGTSKMVGDSADACPTRLSELAAGKYFAQAILDHEFYSANPYAGAGNFHSEVIPIEWDPQAVKPITLSLTQTIPPRVIPQSDWIKLVEIESELLSDFFHRPVKEQAVVILPESYYDQPDKRYPVNYIVSGFGGSLPEVARQYSKSAAHGVPRGTDQEVEWIRVLLSGECKWGHHVYANSATNGPRGDCLITEMIPQIDQQFRTIEQMRARFVSGHSSGGWSSLWLQVNYPDTFGAVFSTAPDPVDFRDYQQVNLYAIPPQSLYFDAEDQPRPLARMRGRVIIRYPDFARMDDTMGRGGQLRSFEAVFSPLDQTGLPAKLWDRQTGRIDLEIAEAWKNYDIQLLLKENWQELAPKLAGKIHVSMGTLDTFYLEGATRLLKESLLQLGSDAEITLVEGADHGSIASPELQQQEAIKMARKYLEYFEDDGKPREN